MNVYQTQIHPFANENHVSIAHQKLTGGCVVAAPTDTVYGIMASLTAPTAIEQIYAIKKRPKSKAIPLLIGDIEQLDQITQLSRLEEQTSLLQRLIQRWWPGPLTLVLPASATLPDILTAGQGTVAVRIPNHHWLRQLLRVAGPLATTSANLSGEAETIRASEVLAQLKGRIPMIFDGGSCAGGVGSTIVDLTDLSENQPRVLRQGPLGDAIKALF